MPNERATRRQAMTLDEYRAAADIDVALLYDAYSSLLWPGWRTALRRLAARFNNVLEAVRQLRGSATSNQVSDVQLALVTGFGGSYGSAAVPPWFGAVTARRSDTSTWVDELLAKRSAS